MTQRRILTDYLPWLSLAVAIAALLLASSKPSTPGPNDPIANETTLDRVRRTREINIGWGGFPPYTRVQPGSSGQNTRVEGFMVDVVSEIAQRAEPPLKVSWHMLQWDTFRADLNNEKFDVIADPVYQTVGRALDFRCSDPISYFGIAIGMVRSDDDRFTKFSDLDREDITIALAEGYTSSEFARKHLTKPRFKSIPVGTDAFPQLDDVILGKSDVALNDTPTIIQYVRAHPTKVKALWLDSPPAVLAGGFLARRQDRDLIDFLNTSLRALRADGTLQKLDAKWKTLGMFPAEQYRAAAGLQNAQ